MPTDLRPLRRKIQARVFRVVNVPMRFVLGMPFPTPLGARLMLISFTGRRTGKAYRQPVSYVRDGDVLLTPGGGRWKFNLRRCPMAATLCSQISRRFTDIAVRSSQSI